MDGVRENFPGAAYTILYIIIQNRILCPGIGYLHRIPVSQ